VSAAVRFVGPPIVTLFAEGKMKPRFVISGLCIVAVAYACGPRTHSEATTQTASLTLASVTPSFAQQGSARETRTKSELTATVYVRTNVSPMRLKLHVLNTSKKRLELTFPSGQTHDFAILDTAGREVWRWASGRMFTQSVRNKLLGGGEAMEFEEAVGSLNLTPGRYIVRATLASQNYPITQAVEFTVGASTLASR
jgi:hypothetical protein